MKRTIGENNDVIESERRKDTLFTFDLEDLTPVEYIAETLQYDELRNFIEKEKKRGSSVITSYSIHYTKLYDCGFSEAVVLKPGKPGDG